MKEPEIINYIPERETPKFRLFFARPAKFGAFFLTRCLYSIDAEGKVWQQNIFIVFVGALTIAAVAVDLVALLLVWTGKLMFYILRSVWDVVLYAVKVVLNKLFGTALKWVTIVLIILILYLKWHEITAIIASWHL